MEKIAIISDIHGNLEALETVLLDIKKRGIDKIMCLGDIIAKGTHQEECVQLIKENCCVVVKGNNDDFYSSDEIDLNGFREIEKKRYAWIRKKLSSDSLKFLQNLPYSYEFYMSGRLVRLFHAHPEEVYKFIGNIEKIERLYELFLPSKNTISSNIADIVIYGHIHTQYMQKIYNRVIINTGSVGNSYDVFRNPLKDGNVLNTITANYLILSGNLNSHNLNDDISYEFVNISYDIDKELKENKDNIEYNEYETELKNGMYRNIEWVNKTFELRGIDKNKI